MFYWDELSFFIEEILAGENAEFGRNKLCKMDERANKGYSKNF